MRLKLVLPKCGDGPNKGKVIQGRRAKLVEIDTGMEIDCVRDVEVFFPLDGIVTARVDFVIAEIECIEAE